MRLDLDERIDWPRYGGAVLTLLAAAAAARCSAERDAIDAVFAWLFWSLLFGACWLLRPRLPRDAAGKPPEGLVNLIGGIALLGFLSRLALSGLLPALAFLLMASQAALLLLAEKRQQLWLLLGAALAAVLFAAAESRSAWFLPCAAWFAFAALGLLSFDRVQAQQRRARGHLVHRPEGGAGGAMFAALTLLLALPLYLFVPKPAGLELGGMSAQSGHDYSDDLPGDAAAQDPAIPGDRPGEQAPGDELDINQVRRERRVANDILMFVDSNAPVNLRMNLLDHFDGSRWRRSVDGPTRRRLERGYYAQPGEAPPRPLLRQRIEVVADLDRRLPTAPGLLRLRFPAPELDEYPDGSWAVLRPLRAPTQYSVEAAPILQLGRYLLPTPALIDTAAYLQLPAELPPRIGDLAHRVAGHGSPLQQALALEQHLREHYQYSFESVFSSQGYTPLDEFLFETRRGHCEYFASALAIMLRSVGIPSRLAQGFSMGDRNPVTGYYEVRRLQAHAWVEAWLPGQGWIMLEPTPFYPLPRPQQDQQVATETEHYLEQAARNARLLDPESLRTALLGALSDSWKQVRHVLQRLADALSLPGYAWPLLALALLLGLPALHLLRLWRADRRNNREIVRLLATAQSGGPQAIVGAAAALQAALATRGAARPAGTPFAPYYEELLAAGVALPPGFGEAFNLARYAEGSAPAELPDSAAVAVAVRDLLARQPHPRCAGQLAAWRATLRGLLQRFRREG